MGTPGCEEPTGRRGNAERPPMGGRWLTWLRVGRWSALRRATRTWDASALVQGSGTVPSMPACLGPATVVFDRSLTEYDFGPHHPMAPMRVDLTMRLAGELGVLSGGGLRQVPAPMASEDLIARVHH